MAVRGTFVVAAAVLSDSSGEIITAAGTMKLHSSDVLLGEATVEVSRQPQIRREPTMAVNALSYIYSYQASKSIRSASPSLQWLRTILLQPCKPDTGIARVTWRWRR